jgi:2-iminoacetate synthase ThiH
LDDPRIKELCTAIIGSQRAAGWKEELRAALRAGAVDLEGTSQSEITRTLKSYRRERRKPELTVVAEAVEATA